MGSGAADEATSQESVLSATMRDHPFAKFSSYDIAHLDAAASDHIIGGTGMEQGFAPSFGGTVTSTKRGARPTTAPAASSVSTATKDPHWTAYKQCSALRSVTASFSELQSRDSQCDIVEVSP